MYREQLCQSRVVEQRFRKIEDRRRKISINKVKKVVQNEWRKDGPKLAKSFERKDGMNPVVFEEVERQN